MSSTADQVVLMRDFFTAGARGLVEAQQALDERGRDSLMAWEENGLPPSVWTWAACRLRCPVAFRCQPKTGVTELTYLTVAPREAGRGSLSLTFRYIPTHQGDEDF